MTNPRLQTIEGVDHLRDFGGYDTVDGLKIARGVLFRSSGLHGATPSGVKALKALKLKLVCDMRSPRERRDTPLPEGVAPQILCSDLNQGSEKVINSYWKDGDLSVDGARAFMHVYYRAMPFELAHMELSARFFKALAVGEAPAVVMSSSGKHRAGFLCALTLVAAGVSREIAMNDYLLGGVGEESPERWQETMARAAKRAGRTVGEEVLRVLTSVERSYLDVGLDAIKAQYGTVYGYLRDGLKIGAHETEALRATILE